MAVMDVRESITLTSGSKVTRDPKSGEVVISRVKFLGERSTNRNADGTHNVYTFESRRKSLPLYEGSAVFLDHDRAKVKERSYAEKLGRLRACEARQDGSYADLHLNPKHPLAEQVAWDAEHSPDSLGLSHDARGQARVQGQDCLVEVQAVSSVDLVAAGATTRSLFESQEATVSGTVPPAAPQTAPATPAAPAPVTEAAKHADEKPAETRLLEERLAKVEESLKAEKAEKDKLAAQVAAFERRGLVDRLLVEAKLPAVVVTDHFRTQLVDAKDEAAMKALIEDRRVVARSAYHSQPQSPLPAGAGGPAPINDFEAFLKAAGSN